MGYLLAARRGKIIKKLQPAGTLIRLSYSQGEPGGSYSIRALICRERVAFPKKVLKIDKISLEKIVRK